MTAIIAIDPGLTGAIAYYDGHVLDVADMPTEARGKRTAVDLETLDGLIARSYTWVVGYSGPPRHAVIENVGTMPKQGLASACNFGKTIGACEMALVAAGCELIRVTPQTWKFGVGLNADPKADTKARKNASRARAQELFPNYAHLFARVKDDGRAEAALMAWWFVHKHARAMESGKRLEPTFCDDLATAALSAEPANNYRDAYEGAREDLLDWKGRAQRAEATLRSLGYQGVDASEPPAQPADSKVIGDDSQIKPERVPEEATDEFVPRWWDDSHGGAYKEGWNDCRASMLAASPAPSPARGDGGEGVRKLAKYQPCGCVICTCDDEVQCHGCGAHHCGSHPVAEFDNPVYTTQDTRP